MTVYARIENDSIVEVGTPTTRPVFFDGRWWDNRDPEERIAYMNAAGWVEVADVTRPIDTQTTTWDLTFEMFNGTPTMVWTERPKTQAELDAAAASANSATIGNRIATVDLPAMQAIIDQTNADLRTDPSQELKDIARAVRRLGRKVQGILDGTD